MITNLRYQLQLTAEQADFLASTSYGHNRMSYLVSLIKRAALKTYPSLVNGSKETVGVGMVERSIKQLSGDWHLDYKTAKEMLKDMNELGIVITRSSPQTSTHVLPVVAAWMVDTVCISNPYFARGYDKSAVLVADLDSTSIANDFNPIMEESISSYMANLPKGGRGKRKSSVDKKVILPTMQGLELYAQMLAKAESHSEESDAKVKQSSEYPTQTANDEGSGSSDASSAHEGQTAIDNHSVGSSVDKSSDTASSGDTEESRLAPTVSDSSETTGEQHTSVSENTSQAVVEAQTVTAHKEPSGEA